jgi:tetratricopeptide (TPR) repeat protein
MKPNIKWGFQKEKMSIRVLNVLKMVEIERYIKGNAIFLDALWKSSSLTFLCGAGISCEPPTRLALAREIKTEIIYHFCTPYTIARIMALNELRFEELVEFVVRIFDKELILYDYFTLERKTNLLHQFLAKQIEDHNLVITTNFDHFIESALLSLNIESRDIFPIIAEPEFQEFKARGKESNEVFPILKLHGSVMCIHDGSERKASLKATLTSLVEGKGMNLFGLEPWKGRIMEAWTRQRILVVVGYSGTDDYDIIPTLNAIHELQGIIWISHDPNRPQNEEILFSTKVQDAHGKFLKSFKEEHPETRVFDVRGNTATLLGLAKYDGTEDDRNVSFGSFIEERFKDPSPLMKALISSKILLSTEHKKNAKIALKCCEDALIDPIGDIELELGLKINKGLAHLQCGDYNAASTVMRNILDRAKSKGMLGYVTFALNDLGAYYLSSNELSIALKFFQQSLKMAQTGLQHVTDPESTILYKEMIVDRQNNIATVYQNQGRIKEAIELYSESQNFVAEVPNQDVKIRYHLNIGAAYLEKGGADIKKAAFHFTEARTIALVTKKPYHLAYSSLNCGFLFDKTGEMEKALKSFENAKDLFLSIDKRDDYGTCLYNIADILWKKGEKDKAFQSYNDALRVFPSNAIHKKATCQNNYASAYLQEEDYSSASILFERAIKALDSANLQGSALYKIISENKQKCKEKMTAHTK